MLQVFVFLSFAYVARCNICCVPRQWEGQEGSQLGSMMDGAAIPNFIQSSVHVSYDAINQKVAATQYMDVDGYQIQAKVIMDYRNGVQYSINGTTCTRTTLPAFQENCIPDGAQETEQTLGAGGKSLAVKTYTMMVANLSVTAQVTEAGCIPISETIIGYSAGRNIHLVTGFSGITPGISNPTVFNPPVMCMAGPIYPADISMRKRVSFLHPL
ncbi:mammalian ependymin-related protein 1-like [Ostrea edulis]|uniref:mammalian ependymin-related protein 1-like n=1 Tax=Ostrea edulis TaxID=37623 RepID=UPI002095BCE5|nr:mammalian ependymin-related protein 1-like [Ostrea edulis]